MFIEQYVAQNAEPSEVVLVGVKGAMPGSDVERGMVLCTRPQTASLSGDDGPLGVVGHGDVRGDLAIEAGSGNLEVPYVGEAGAADGAELGEAEV